LAAARITDHRGKTPFGVVRTETQISLVHRYALRTTCLLLLVGLGFGIRMEIIDHEKASHPMQEIVCCSLAALPAMAVSGVRCPLQIL